MTILAKSPSYERELDMLRSISLFSVRSIVQEHGGELLEPVVPLRGEASEKDHWVQLVRVRCKRGHTWTANAEKILSGGWCGNCRKGPRKHSIEEMKMLAAKRGGVCLSEVYESVSSKLQWRCKRGHVWWGLPNGILQHKWCFECSVIEQQTPVEVFHQIARQRGGKCLVTEYINQATPIEWECAMGHRWKACAGNVRTHTWCPKCFRVRSRDRRKRLRQRNSSQSIRTLKKAA